MQNQIQDIATSTASSTAREFLEAIPSEVAQALPSRFLQQLQEELQTELQALIQSRLLWSQQAVQLELDQPQRLQAFKPAASEPSPTESIS